MKCVGSVNACEHIANIDFVKKKLCLLPFPGNADNVHCRFTFVSLFIVFLSILLCEYSSLLLLRVYCMYISIHFVGRH